MTRSVFRRFERATIMRRRRFRRRAAGSNSLDVQSRMFAQSVGFSTVSSNRNTVHGDKRHFVPLLSPLESGEIALRRIIAALQKKAISRVISPLLLGKNGKFSRKTQTGTNKKI